MTRNRWYFTLMGLCLLLVALSWTVVRMYSVTAAVIMSVAAMAIPPIAIIVVNAGDEGSRRMAARPQPPGRGPAGPPSEGATGPPAGRGGWPGPDAGPQSGTDASGQDGPGPKSTGPR